jgi:hemolysin activation/secretion protein
VLDYTIARGQLVRLMQLDARWTLRVDVLAQYSDDVLPYSERFKIGGDRIGRGFEVTEVAGDRGAGGKMELRRELTLTGTPLFGRTSVYSFYDFGAVWSASGSGTRQSATSGGLGFALNGERLGGYLELAKPFTRPDLEGRHAPTLFAEISYRL